MMQPMADGPPSIRSVKIDADERTGWSSDRPRREGAPPREADVSVRNRVLRPADRMRYSPGSLVVLVSASKDVRDAFADRAFESKNAILSLDKVRALLAGRVPDDQIEARAPELLEAAVTKRLEAEEAVVLAADGLDGEQRERFVRVAAKIGRPRHLILLETARDQVADEDLAPLNALRSGLDAGELGAEGFHTSLRLGGGSADEVKRIVFRPEPRDD
jgi:AAA domain-containing protein